MSYKKKITPIKGHTALLCHAFLDRPIHIAPELRKMISELCEYLHLILMIKKWKCTENGMRMGLNIGKAGRSGRKQMELYSI